MQNKTEQFHYRKLTRLADYCYAEANYYFITICTHNKQCWFGDIIGNNIKLNKYGNIVKTQWGNLTKHYPNCTLDQFVIMPNHLHGIVVIDYCIAPKKPPKYSVSEIVRGFKTFSSREINKQSQIKFAWQKSFYDHIIRNERSLYEIRSYIANNPIQWQFEQDRCENNVY